MRRTEVSGSQADLLVPLAQRVDRDHPFPVCRRAWSERGLERRGRTRVTCLTRGKNYGYRTPPVDSLRVSMPRRGRPLRASSSGQQVLICRSSAIGAPRGGQLLGAACRDLSVERQRGPSGRQLLGAACRRIPESPCRRVPADPVIRSAIPRCFYCTKENAFPQCVCVHVCMRACVCVCVCVCEEVW